MRQVIRLIAWTCICGFFFYSWAESRSYDDADKIESFFKKKGVVIAVMDSGLGGLSIMADAMERMREAKVFHSVHFLFFNALFSNEGGYNSLPGREEKTLVLNSALNCLESQYQPDLILIGCNTLSALYKGTPFSRQTQVPVKGIIETGVALIAQNLKARLETKAILFGTQTTVGEHTYEKELKKRGFPSDRIVSQACPDLVPYIEAGYDSDDTEMLISAYADEALQKMGTQRSAFYVSLNCTHYGYSLGLWKKAFRNLGVEPLDFLNPNSRMNDFLFANQKRKLQDSQISAEVVSTVPIDKQKIESIGRWLKTISSQTARALANYTYRENLFEWKKFVTQTR